MSDYRERDRQVNVIMNDAYRAIHRGDAAAAERLIAEAVALRGAETKQIRQARSRLRAMLQASAKRVRLGGWLGTTAAVLCYFFLLFVTPPEVGWALWAVLALLIAPVGCGWIVGMAIGEARSGRHRFRVGALCVGIVCGLYVLISITMVRGRLSVPDPNWLKVALFVSFVYAAAAALVAGTAARYLFKRSRRST
jgi:hypothetical protein